MSGRAPIRADGIGIPWYKRSDYRRIIEIMDDPENFPVTFDKWQSGAERNEREVRRSGGIAVRAPIDPEHFVTWCASTNRRIDADARLDWANLAVARHLRGENG